MFYSQKKFELSPRLKLGVGRGYSQNQILKISGIICLLVAGGLTLNALRLIVFSNQSPAGQPQVLGATDVRSTENKSEVQFIEYTIQKGDTLFNVSQAHHISWTTLATLNGLESPFILKPGNTLKIPR